jgi:hypothetical protein
MNGFGRGGRLFHSHGCDDCGCDQGCDSAHQTKQPDAPAAEPKPESSSWSSKNQQPVATQNQFNSIPNTANTNGATENWSGNRSTNGSWNNATTQPIGTGYSPTNSATDQD